MEKKRILIVEDETSLHESLGEFLSAEGFEVLNAYDGEVGLSMAREKMPDLVLLDIILPKKDGYEVLAEIRKSEKTKNMPVILLTNLESAEDVQKAFEKGATTYLVKSDYKMEDVVRKIKETLKK
ncbi:MAG: two-component system, OmpR family, alkaline phosphatase synthesis response regulator PhoP [Patescibacteria group bacterium]|nr:two-component system, OmpR family, alkaline phosphatase synthesis response regulator PhoP [Patescibacteria group bacterium]